MTTQLIEIQPRELQFIVELKKQSSCSIRLTNNTHQHVAFKVKTTSPKKYCVRPNVGIIMPKSTCDFTVTMQAQRSVPHDLVCKDKFLIQSTGVPAGTTEEDITPSTFAKDAGKYIEENKLKVVLVSPPYSPVLLPMNGTLKQGPAYEASVLKDPFLSKIEILTAPHMVSKEVKQSIMVDSEELSPSKDADLKPTTYVVDNEELKPVKKAELKPTMFVFDNEELKLAKEADLKPTTYVVNGEKLKPAKNAELNPMIDDVIVEELKPAEDAEFKLTKDAVVNGELKPADDAELKPTKDAVNDKELSPVNDEGNGEELKLAKDLEFNLSKVVELRNIKPVEEPKVVKDIEEMKLKLNKLESKLSEAEVTITKLTEERRLSFQERRILKEELVFLKSKAGLKRVQVGFPLLFVCMVALVSVVVGYLSHP